MLALTQIHGPYVLVSSSLVPKRRKSHLERLPCDLLFSVMDYLGKGKDGYYLQNKTIRSLFQTCTSLMKTRKLFLLQRAVEMSALLSLTKPYLSGIPGWVQRDCILAGSSLQALDLQVIPQSRTALQWRSRVAVGQNYITSWTTGKPWDSNAWLKMVVQLMPNLKKLVLPGITLDDESLWIISQLHDLEILKIDGSTAITDYGLGFLQNNSKLRSLALNRCPHITSHGIYSLRTLQLEILDLSYCVSLTNGAMYQVSEIKSLRSLFLRGLNKITNGSIRHLITLPLLQRLDLSYCNRINNQGIADLSQHQPLTSLTINNLDNITNSSLYFLSQLVNLLSLNIANCRRISSVGLERIKLHPVLQFFTVKGCVHVNPWAIEDLQAAKPKLKIVS